MPPDADEPTDDQHRAVPPAADDPVLVAGAPLPSEGAGSLASILPRALARMTDAVVSLLIPFTVLASLVAESSVDEDGRTLTTYPWWVGLVIAVIVGTYEIGLVAWRGQTLGMMIGGLRVVREDDGEGPTLRDSTRRAALPLLWLVLGAVLPILRIGYVVVYLSPIADSRHRRGWHERMSGTLVVRTR